MVNIDSISHGPKQRIFQHWCSDTEFVERSSSFDQADNGARDRLLEQKLFLRTNEEARDMGGGGIRMWAEAAGINESFYGFIVAFRVNHGNNAFT